MKNCDEMVESLLERRAQYAAEQKGKRARIARIAAAAGCACLAVLLGVGIWQGGKPGAAQPEQTVADALYPGIKDTFDVSRGESPVDPAANNKIIVHPVSGVSADRAIVGLKDEDFVAMTREEMVEYFGVNYIPEVPEDILPWEDERSGVYRKDGGTGEVYWAADILNYADADFTRTVHVEVNKGSDVPQCCLYFEGKEEKSVINSVELLIGQSKNGYYYAEFQYQNVGFLISAGGVTQEEFVNILASILK